MIHTRLTPKQADDTRRMYRELLALSRKRCAFIRQCHALGWPAPHIPELWGAFMRVSS